MQTSEPLVFVGAYTRTLGKGIYAFRFRPSGDLAPLGLVAETPHPSFLAVHPNGRFLYAPIEHEGDDPPGVDNAVCAFAIDRTTGGLRFINKVSSCGEGPNHISLDHTGRTLLVANFRNGTVAALGIEVDGRLSEATSIHRHTGSSVHPVRQLGPHAHFICPSPDNRFVVAVDLGTDRVVHYRFDGQRRLLSQHKPPFTRLAPGAQPRHLAFHPTGRYAYVNGEASSKVYVFEHDEEKGTLIEIQQVSSLPAGFTATSTTAEIGTDRDGRFLYVTNRGHDSVAVFAIDASGRLTFVEHAPTNGQTPRHFALDPSGRFLLVGNQNSHTLLIYIVDRDTGRLTPLQTVSNVPEPACIVFAPPAQA